MSEYRPKMSVLEDDGIAKSAIMENLICACECARDYSNLKTTPKAAAEFLWTALVALDEVEYNFINQCEKDAWGHLKRDVIRKIEEM